MNDLFGELRSMLNTSVLDVDRDNARGVLCVCVALRGYVRRRLRCC